MLVSIAHSSLFDEAALADALASGRMAAAWLDSLEPGALDPGRPLHDIDTLQVTPRVAEHDARVAHAQRLGGGAAHRRAAERPTSRRRADFKATIPDALA